MGSDQSNSRRSFVAAAIGATLAAGPSFGDPQDLTRLTLKKATELLRSKAASPVELTKACLHRVERYDSPVNVYNRHRRISAHHRAPDGRRGPSRQMARTAAWHSHCPQRQYRYGWHKDNWRQRALQRPGANRRCIRCPQIERRRLTCALARSARTLVDRSVSLALIVAWSD